MTHSPGADHRAGSVTGDASAPVPKVTELRVEALHADGSRVYLTYPPEDDDRGLRITMENVEEEPPPITSRSLLTFWRRHTHQRLDIRGVGTWKLEHLVRPSY